MYSLSRDEMRRFFFDVWEKHLKKIPLEPLEQQLLQIMLEHPEYHAFLNNREQYQFHDFTDDNPFLHMSLHLALVEQIKMDRPQGIRIIYQKLFKKIPVKQDVEHRMLLCLTDMLADIQNGQTPDEAKYLNALKRLV